MPNETDNEEGARGNVSPDLIVCLPDNVERVLA